MPQWTLRRSSPMGVAVFAVLFVSACSDSEGTGPGALPPVLRSISVSTATPDDSPLVLVVTGERISGAQVSATPPLFVDVISRTPTEIRLRAGFQGSPPGQHWITVTADRGRDSIAFRVEPLPAGTTLTETRALWVSRFEYRDADDIRHIIDRAGTAGFNTVFLQVRGRADAFYDSAHEPWSQRLSGTLGEDPGWDPLELAVSEAEQVGIEIHAWINAFTGWATTTPPPVSDPLHAFLAHPDWVMVDESGLPMPYQAGTRWLNPGHPGVRSRLAAVAADIVRKYEVAGVHLDFIRYPNPGYSYDEQSLAQFDAARALEPSLDFTEMRRRFVQMAVAEARDSMDVAGPEMILSAAVWGIYDNALGWNAVSDGLNSVLQDARSWDRAGVIDALVPMVYWRMKPGYGDRLDFAYLADDHAENVQSPVFIGMFVPDMDGPALAQHIERARIAGADGVSLFSYSGLENGDLWDVLPAGPFYWPAESGRSATDGAGRRASPDRNSANSPPTESREKRSGGSDSGHATTP